MNFSLRQIRYFIAAAETGQVTQAAAELNVSQSAVTTAIKHLEEELQVQLFERSSHGISMTWEGSQFLFRARNIITAVEEAPHFARRGCQNVSGRLRLGFSYTVAGYYIPSLLARFTRDYPNIELVLEEAARRDIEEGLISGRYDLSVILTSNILNVDDLDYQVLFSSGRRLWLRTDHPLLEQGQVGFEQVSQEPYIMLTVDEASHTAERYWNRTPYKPNTIFRTSSIEAVRSLVAHGLGVTILSDMVYRPWSLEGRRVMVMALADPVPAMNLGMAWKKGREFSPAEAAFRDFMAFNGGLSKGEVQPLQG